MAISPETVGEQQGEQSALFDEAFLRKIEQLDLLARKVFRGQLRGEHTTARRGRGIEFSDFRRYRPGDDIRHIDWNIYSRLDRLFLKLYATEEDISLHVLMDTSASMDFGEANKFDHARRLAAALAYIALNNLDRVSVTCFASNLGASLMSLKSRHQMASLLDMLGNLRSDGRTSLGSALREFAQRSPHPGLVVLISDFLDDDEAAFKAGMQALRSRGHEVFVLQLLSEDEIVPVLNGAMRLHDAESGETLNVTVDPLLRKLYQEQLQARLQKIERYCARQGIEYLRASTVIGFEDIVLKYLRRGALLN